MKHLLKELSAWLPIAMSIAVICMLLSMFVFTNPHVHESDEGFAAHVFQILMIGQLPIIAYFANSWIPRVPRTALRVLALQIFVWVLAAAPIFVMRL
jgi:hypothetical protein